MQINRDELLDMPIELQGNIMMELRETKTVKEICQLTGIPEGGSFYNYLRFLGLPTKGNGLKKDEGIATLGLYKHNKIKKIKK